MILTNKTAWDIDSQLERSPQKVDSRQYLTNIAEPRRASNAARRVIAGVHSGIIKDTFLRKEMLREAARKLRAVF